MTNRLTIGRAALTLLLLASVLAGCSGAPTRPAADTSSIINPERGTRGNPPSYEVAGQRYFVMNTSDGYREQGVASWYGRDFHGRATSSGEIYDMNLLTAAHKTLPLPTWVEVTNLNNGRRIIVKVNDRGPFVSGRIIDLSQRAASDLGMLEAGTARVQVRALGAPAVGSTGPTVADQGASSSRGFSIISDAQAADSIASDQTPYRPYYIQVGAFSDRNNAEKLARQLKNDGFGNSFVLTSSGGRDRLHRVRVGPLQPSEFGRVRADLEDAGLSDLSVVQDN